MCAGMEERSAHDVLRLRCRRELPAEGFLSPGAAEGALGMYLKLHGAPLIYETHFSHQYF